MGLVALNVFPRETSGKNANRRTRSGGRIPAVLYGNGKETSKIEVDNHEFVRAIASVGGSSVIFTLKQKGITEEPIALLREVQRNPVNDAVLHIDLFEIPRGQRITAPVRVELEGEPVDVKRGDAVVGQTLDTVEVSCLPRELPERVTLDISEMHLGDRIFVKDLTIEAGEITSDPENLVVLLKAPTVFLEEEPEAEEAEGEEAVAATEEEAAMGSAEPAAEGEQDSGDKG